MKNQLSRSELGFKAGCTFLTVACLILLSVQAFAESMDHTLSGQKKTRDLHLAVFPQDLMHGKQKESDRLFVDVRNPGLFAQARIPGSINIPMYAIQTKGFLKAKPIILVNNGDRYSELESQARFLRDKGFEASVLVGGLNSWKVLNGDIEGDSFKTRDWDAMPPHVFLQENKYNDWMIIDFCTSSMQPGQILDQKTIRADLAEGMEETVKRVMDGAKALKKGRGTHFLVLNERGGDYDRLKAVMKKTGLSNIFFLQGGLAAYKQYLDDLAVMAEPSQKRMKTTNKCPTCGDLAM